MTASLQRAMALHQAGQWAEAEAGYRRILAADPKQVSALHLLGVLTQQTGRAEEAVDHMTRALALQPDFAEAHGNLGIALFSLGQTAEAVECYRQALMLRPDFAEAYSNLGNAARCLGHLAGAVICCRRALAISSDFADAQNNLAHTLKDLGRLEDAAASYRRVLQLQPGDAITASNLGTVLVDLGQLSQAEECYRQALELAPDSAQINSNLGNVLQERGQSQEAEPYCRRALELAPTLAEAHCNLGNVLWDLKRLDEAEASYRQAIAINPGFAMAYSNLGKTLKELGRMEDGAQCCRLALEMSPDLAAAYNNLGNAIKELDQWREAEVCYLRARRIDPGNILAQTNLAFLRFGRGILKTAWADYEMRWAHPKQYKSRPFVQPRWRGEPLGTGGLLIWGEQGVGDEILGASMLPDMMARGGKLLLECDPRLVTLFTRSFPGIEVFPRQDPPQDRALQAALQVPIMDLGPHLRSELSQFPHHHGYLVPDRGRIQHWKRWLDGLGPGLKVGVSWRGRLVNIERSRHYVPLLRLQEILAVPGICFVNLQYDGYTEEIEALRVKTGHVIHCPPDLDLTDDFDGIAALMANLDGVVSPSTSVAILAGAMGRPTWMYALRSSSEKEILGCDRLPWCPSVQVAGINHGDDWDVPLGTIAQSLRRWAEDPARQAAGSPIP